MLTGNAGCGKSFLMKVIYQPLKKTLPYGDVVIGKPRVLLMAPTMLLLYKWIAQQYTLP